MEKKTNDVLEEQIKMLFKMLDEIKQMLSEIKNDSVSKEQFQSALALYEEKSKSRTDRLEIDINILKKFIYTLGAGVLAALGKSFSDLFHIIIK